MPKGNKSGKRGHRPRSRFHTSPQAGTVLLLLAWQRLGRPATDEEATALLNTLILEERNRVVAAEPPREGDDLVDWAARLWPGGPKDEDE